MSTRLLPLAGAVLATAVAAAAWAQTPAAALAPPAKIVGRIGQVQGLVTVSSGTSVGSATANAPVLDGSRIVTGSSGLVDLDFADGCVVKMAPGQSFTVAAAMSCDDRKGAVVFLPGSASAVAAATGGGGFSPLVGLGYVASIALIDRTLTSTPTPSTGGGGTTPGGGGGIPNPPPSGQ